MANLNEVISKLIAERFVRIVDSVAEKLENGIEVTDTEICLLVLALKDKYLQESNAMILDEILPKILGAINVNKEILEILENTSVSAVPTSKSGDFLN